MGKPSMNSKCPLQSQALYLDMLTARPVCTGKRATLAHHQDLLAQQQTPLTHGNKQLLRAGKQGQGW